MRRFLNYNINLYRQITPSLNQVEKVFGFDRKKGYPLDHVAFRTFKSFGGISIFSSMMFGGKIEYKEMDTYSFPSKKLTAKWFQPITYKRDKQTEKLPRLFISELEDHLLSAEAQKIIQEHGKTPRHLNYFSEGDGIDHSSYLWGGGGLKLTLKEYETLRNESEYAAWTLLHGCKINHVAFSLDQIIQNIIYNRSNPHNGCLSTSFSFEELVYFLGICDYKFSMVDSGGSIIKTSDDGLLLQSSIQSDVIKIPFSRTKEENLGDFETVSVGGGFVEFIQRKHGREGFEAKSALHIFDSTTISKT